MSDFIKVLVDEEFVNERLDLFLTEIYPEISRNKIQTHIKSGLVLVNNNKVKTGYLLKEEDLVTMKPIKIDENKYLDIKPVNLNLDIIYEDDHLLIVNKPKDLVVHPAPTHEGDTLVHGLLYQVDKLSTINSKTRPGIVHRLDKDTSGLLIVAKSNEAHQILAKEISFHNVKRHYYAICYGTFSESTGTIKMPIGRDEKNRIKMAVTKDGRPSVTHFKVLEQYLNHTLLDVELETGRTHQIRVHLSAINHPILGDPLYGPKNVFGNVGQYLHAYKLSFKHPITKKEMEFETPLPNYFKEIIDQLI